MNKVKIKTHKAAIWNCGPLSWRPIILCQASQFILADWTVKKYRTYWGTPTYSQWVKSKIKCQHLFIFYVHCKKSTASLKLIDKLIVSPDTSNFYVELLTEWTAELGSLRPEGAVDCVLSVTERLRSGHTERGLPQRTAVSVRCGMLHSKQTLLTIIFWKHSS